MHAFHSLSEQLRPYLTGYPWKYAQSKMANWQGSHIEEGMRGAAALLGGFSIEELRKRMAAFEEEERKAKAAKTA